MDDVGVDYRFTSPVFVSRSSTINDFKKEMNILIRLLKLGKLLFFY